MEDVYVFPHNQGKQSFYFRLVPGDHGSCTLSHDSPRADGGTLVTVSPHFRGFMRLLGKYQSDEGVSFHEIKLLATGEQGFVVLTITLPTEGSPAWTDDMEQFVLNAIGNVRNSTVQVYHPDPAPATPDVLEIQRVLRIPSGRLLAQPTTRKKRT